MFIQLHTVRLASTPPLKFHGFRIKQKLCERLALNLRVFGLSAVDTTAAEPENAHLKPQSFMK